MGTLGAGADESLSILPGLSALSISSRDARLALLGIAAVAAAAAFPLRDALFGGRVLFWRDVHMGWLPLTEVVARGVADGELPLWDRFAGFGRPLLADGRAALLYAPSWLGLLLPRGTAYTWFVYLHLLLAGSGALVLGRRLGSGYGPALAGALAFTLSGPLLSLSIMWHQLAGAAWMPWALLAGDIAASSGGRLAVAAAAAVLALQVHAGSFEYALLTALALPVLVLARAERSARPRAALRLLAVAALAAALAAPQVLPTLLRARESARVDDREAASVWSLHPLRLLETALPLKLIELPLSAKARSEIFENREPLLHSVYLGAGLVSLAVVGAAAGRTGAGLGMLLLGFVGFALGRHTPFLALASALLPPLGLLRYPQKAMLPAALVAALLAGLGLTALAETRARKRTAALAALVALAALLLGSGAQLWLGAGWISAAANGRSVPGSIAVLSWQAAALAALPALALLLRLSRPAASQARAIGLGAAALSFVPALAAHDDLLWTAPKDYFEHRPKVLEHLDLEGHARVYGYDYMITDAWQLVTNPPTGGMQVRDDRGLGWAAAWVRATHQSLHPPLGARWGVPGSFDFDILDFDPPEQKELCRLLRAREATPDHRRLLQVGAVRYAVSVVPGTWWRDLEPVARVPTLFAEPATVLRVPDPLPRAYAVGTARAARSVREAGARLLARDFDPRREVVLVGASAVPTSGDRLAGEGAVAIKELRANRVRLEASLAHAGFVVLVDAWAPGWSATIDGLPTEILRANGVFRAVRVPAGRHAVEMRYWPPGLTLGLAVAGLAAAGMLAAILAGPRWREPAP